MKFTQDEQNQLSQALEECHAIRQKRRRAIIVQKLPDDIARHIEFDGAMLLEVASIVSVCASFPRGLHELGKAVLAIEGGTHQMKVLGKRILPLVLMEAMCEIFEDNAPSLRFFITVNLGNGVALPDGDTADAVLPMARAAVQYARKQRLMDANLIEQLAAHASTDQERAYLEAIQATWLAYAPRKREIAGEVPPVSAEPLPGSTENQPAQAPPATTPASPAPGIPETASAEQSGPPSRLSMVMDRWRQWDALTRECNTADDHIAFLIHGHVDQDLHLFSGRVQDYLSTECKPIHRVFQVKFRTQYTIADNAEIWSNHLRQSLGFGRGLDTAQAIGRAARHEPVMLVLGNGVLCDLDTAQQQALLQFLGDDLPRAIRASVSFHPVRVLVPIAFRGPSAAFDPMLQAVWRILEAAGGLRLADLTEARYPTWDEVADTLRREYDGDPTGLLPRAQAVYQALERDPEKKTFARLTEELDRLLARH